MTDEEMAATLKAKGWRIEPPLTQETCDHPAHMRNGTGTVNYDGSGRWSWTCMKCGKITSGETKPRRGDKWAFA